MGIKVQSAMEVAAMQRSENLSQKHPEEEQSAVRVLLLLLLFVFRIRKCTKFGTQLHRRITKNSPVHDSVVQSLNWIE